MYNRYVPQSDGSYQRNHVYDKPKPAQQPQPRMVQQQESEHRSKQYYEHRPQHKPEPVGGFLKQLLPKNFDTADLIVILLILLMAGDNEEDRTTAMLTLVLYLFM